jgi:hypothetical protein
VAAPVVQRGFKPEAQGLLAEGAFAYRYEAYRCEPVRPGVYHSVPGLVLRVVVLSELPRVRETLLLRLLGRSRVLQEALADLAALPKDAWERSITAPLLVHFQLGGGGQAENEEADVNAEMQAWFNEYQQQLRKEGASSLLLRQLRARFGELPAATVARIEAAEAAELELWGERLLAAQTLAEVLDKPS